MQDLIVTRDKRVSWLSKKTRVAVCVATYQRPKGLKSLIEGLDKLTFDKCETPSLELIVVDNDAAGPAYVFCQGIRSELNWTLKCCVESRRGIPYARNKAVAWAQEHADFLAFIDDDEVPEPSWIDELLYAQRLYNADVVAGAVLPRFAVSVAPWKAELFERRRFATGHLIDWASTNNVLVRSEVFEQMDRLFDERLALSGGSDKEFFARVHRRGYKMVWADEALAYETVPESRASVRWVAQRWYRYGNNYSLLAIESKSSIAARASLVAEASKGIVRSVSRLLRSSVRIQPNKLQTHRSNAQPPTKLLWVILWSAVADPRSLLRTRRNLQYLRVLLRSRFRRLRRLVRIRHRQVINSVRFISRSVGILAGITGRRYEEYRRIHGE
jgi:glycosyltransferase involved in cell wall biosynthesis